MPKNFSTLPLPSTRYPKVFNIKTDNNITYVPYEFRYGRAAPTMFGSLQPGIMKAPKNPPSSSEKTMQSFAAVCIDPFKGSLRMIMEPAITPTVNQKI